MQRWLGGARHLVPHPPPRPRASIPSSRTHDEQPHSCSGENVPSTLLAEYAPAASTMCGALLLPPGVLTPRLSDTRASGARPTSARSLATPGRPAAGPLHSGCRAAADLAAGNKTRLTSGQKVVGVGVATFPPSCQELPPAALPLAPAPPLAPPAPLPPPPVLPPPGALGPPPPAPLPAVDALVPVAFLPPRQT